MEAIPIVVRERIMLLYAQGKSTQQIAGALGYSVAAVRRVRQRFSQRGTLVPQTHLCGSKGRFTPERQGYSALQAMRAACSKVRRGPRGWSLAASP